MLPIGASVLGQGAAVFYFGTFAMERQTVSSPPFLLRDRLHATRSSTLRRAFGLEAVLFSKRAA
jgi:hypothetical protein